MIEHVVEQWHRYMRGELPGGLDSLLDDDVVFYSPIVFTPAGGEGGHHAVPAGRGRRPPGGRPPRGRVGTARSRRRFPLHEEGARRRHRRPRVRDLHRREVRQRRGHHPVQRRRADRRVPGHDPPLQAVERRAPADGGDAGADVARTEDPHGARDARGGTGRTLGSCTCTPTAATPGWRSSRSSWRSVDADAVVAAPTPGWPPGQPGSARASPRTLRRDRSTSRSRIPSPPVVGSPARASPGPRPGGSSIPFVRHEQRYWSGTAWTEHVMDGGTPAIDPPPAGTPPEAPTRPVRSGPRRWPQVSRAYTLVATSQMPTTPGDADDDLVGVPRDPRPHPGRAARVVSTGRTHA